MAIADKLAGRSDRWHIAVIGDGALTGGMAVEALNHAGVYKEGLKLLIIVNDNDCSISPPAGALSGHLAKLVSSRPVWKARELSKSGAAAAAAPVGLCQAHGKAGGELFEPAFEPFFELRPQLLRPL